MRAKVYGNLLAATVHATIIVVLSIAVVRVPVAPVLELIPEPPRIEIGDQLIAPPAASPEEPVPDAAPPAGLDIPVPAEDEQEVIQNDDAMLTDPDEAPPADRTKAAEQGVLGEPRREVAPVDPRQVFGPEAPGVPDLYGIPLDGDTLFLVDLSGSMGEKYSSGTRFSVIAAELIKAIQAMRDIDRFDVVAFNGKFLPQDSYTKHLWGSMRLATDSNKQLAADWLGTLVPEGDTPTYEALQHACTVYPDSVKNLILITDGVPNSGTEHMIISSIQRWLSHFEEVSLVCISVSNDGLSFVKKLVDAAGGAYVLVP